MDDHKAIGARIRQARLEKGLTQVELAVAIGVSRAHLTNAERGKGGLALDKLSILASETGTTVAWLIGETSDVTDPIRAELLAAFDALADQRDKETAVRLIRSLLRDPPAAPATTHPKGTDPPPFRMGGRVKEKPAADCETVVPYSRPA
jgi:transcriptional regulator with XRE-family HTH domain